MAPSIRKWFLFLVGAVVLAINGTSYVTGIAVAVTQTGLAISGHIAILRCDYRTQFSSTPPGLVYWNSDDQDNFISGTSNLNITNRYRPRKYTMRFDEASNVILKILDLGFADEMAYTCYVITEKGSGGSTKFTLAVLVPPSGITIVGISSANREVVVVSGQPYTLTCTSGSSKPTANITWSKVDVNSDLQLTTSGQFSNASALDNHVRITWSNAIFTPYLAHDEKRLQCLVTHVALSSEISANVILRVMVPPREMSLKDADLDVILTGSLDVDDGETINFECSAVEAYPAAAISWTIGQPEGDNDTIDATSTVTETGNLLVDTVSRIQLDISSEQHHNQLLTCEARLRIGSTVHKIQKSVTLKVHGPPDKVTLTGTDHLVVGNRSVISCLVANGFPEPKVIWDIDGQDVTGMANTGAPETIRGRYTVESSLWLEPKKTDNGKTVRCSAVHTGVRRGISHVTNTSALLHVRYCPSSISATCPVVRDGYSASVRCGQVTSNPATVISILEKGVAVHQTLTIVDNRDVTLPFQGVTTEVSYERKFTKDQGPRDFQCCTVPSSMCPNETCQLCKVDIQYPPEVYRLPVNEGHVREATEGDYVNLTCCADANPAPDGLIWWQSRDPHDVRCSPEGYSQSIPTTRESTHHVCSVLTFSPVTARDAGTHTCLANNGLPLTYSVTFELQVKFPPCTSTDESSILENEGSEANLHCDVIANPSSDITWYFDDKPIDTSSPRYTVVTKIGSGGSSYQQTSIEMDINAISASLDAGNYTCVANNSLGRDASTVELKIATIPDQPRMLQAPRHAIRETSLLVTWEPGYNGGKRQTFRLAYCLVESMTSCPELSNLQNASFTFAEDTLKPFTLYEIRVWSQNEVGQSEAVSFTISTKPLSPSDLGFDISYSPSQGVVTMQFVGGSTVDRTIPDDLCIQVEVNLGQGWLTTEECLDLGAVKTVQPDLLSGQLQGISCGRGLCSAPSLVIVQNNQGIPWIIIIIIITGSTIGGVIIIILIILLCRYLCRKKKGKDALRTLSKPVASNTDTQASSSWYQPLTFPMMKTSLSPSLKTDRLDTKGKTDDDDDYEDFTYAIPDQPRDRAFMYDDTSTKVCSDVNDDGYVPMATFRKASSHRRPPKPLPNPTATYDSLKGQLYENLRI